MSITPVNWATIPDGSSSSTSTTASSTTQSPADLTSKSTFLTLLVAQIKNQNPLNPTDGVQFLTQLTQFSQLEQAITTNQDLTSIQQTLDQKLAAPAPSASSSASGAN
jgi:flagellar basal-body rod modification protein FlgD